MSEQLKPCPFCGGSAVEIRTDDNGISWYIFCNDCGLMAGYAMTKDDLVVAWNRRTEQPELIRCKDCKYWCNHKRLNIPWCRAMHIDRGADDFCSDAERRTNE